MYAKVFAQIYDGTLCTKGPWQALVTFQQFLVLADQDGNVDMTAAAIARRTTIPLEIIALGIKELMKDDPESRTPTEDGRRLMPLCEGRSWGWRIVNYKHYRALKREEERKEYHRQYWHKRKDKDKDKAATKAQAEARSAVYNALNAGALKQEDCAECGAFPTEAHHEDRHHKHSTIPSTNQPDATKSTRHNTLNGIQPIAEAEAEANTKAKTRAEAATASRLPADWVPSDSDQGFCTATRPDLDCKAVADAFRDYWASVPGAKGRKLDWSATWRNWVRKENRARTGPASQSLHDKRAATIQGLTRPLHERAPSTERDITGECSRVA